MVVGAYLLSAVSVLVVLLVVLALATIYTRAIFFFPPPSSSLSFSSFFLPLLLSSSFFFLLFFFTPPPPRTNYPNFSLLRFTVVPTRSQENTYFQGSMASFLNGPTLSSRSFEIFENDKGIYTFYFMGRRGGVQNIYLL